MRVRYSDWVCLVSFKDIIWEFFYFSYVLKKMNEGDYKMLGNVFYSGLV